MKTQIPANGQILLSENGFIALGEVEALSFQADNGRMIALVYFKSGNRLPISREDGVVIHERLKSELGVDEEATNA